MPSSTVIKRAFAEELLPFLKEIDFEFTMEKRDEFHHRDVLIEKGGRFYNFRTIYLGSLSNGIVEIRVHAYDYNPTTACFHNGIQQSCFVYSNYPKRYSTISRPCHIVIDKYFIDNYRKQSQLKEKCFYCNRINKNGTFHVHDKCAKHATNKKAVVTDLAKAARLPEDCMRHILSYLY